MVPVNTPYEKISAPAKKNRGRPRVAGRVEMLLTLHPDDLAALDAWRAAQPQPMSRQAAIRAMIRAAS